MAGKISEYTTEQTTLDDTDRLDVSTDLAGTPTTKYLSWGSLKTQLGTAGFLSSGDVDLSYTAATRTIGNTGGDDTVLPLFTSTEAGLVPLSGGSATDFLSADGTFKSISVPAGEGGIYGGSGSLSGSTTVTMGANDLTFNTTSNDGFRVESTQPLVQNLYKNATGGNVAISFSANNSVASKYTFAQAGGRAEVTTAGSEEGAFLIQLSENGTIASSGAHKFKVNGLTEFPESINGGIYRDIGSNTSGLRWTLSLNNSAGAIEPYAALGTEIIDNTNGSEDGILKFYSRTGGVNFSGSNYGMALTGAGLKIGTGTPTAKLHVGGDTQIDGNQQLNGTLTTTSVTHTIGNSVGSPRIDMRGDVNTSLNLYDGANRLALLGTNNGSNGLLNLYTGAGVLNTVITGSNNVANPSYFLSRVSVGDASGDSSYDFSVTGDTRLNGALRLDATTTTSATAGANGDVPAQVDGYITINIGGVDKKIPYYAV